MDEITEKYKNYSIEELEGVLLNIDKEKYPERYKFARNELDKKLMESRNELPIDEQNNFNILASLSDRFAAALVDGFIIVILFWILMLFVFGLHGFINFMIQNRFMYILLALITGQVLYVVLNGRLLYKYGQTIGKKFLEIKIVDMDDRLPELYVSYGMRYFLPALFPLVPIIGMLASFVDILFIFKKDRRCIHDHIAGTKVVKVNPNKYYIVN